MADALDVETIPFLRGVDGKVSVLYGVNEDPVYWGYAVLELEWFTPELVRGFPVMQASVEYSAEGYAADMGWLQVVRYTVSDPGQEGQATVFDVPPQLAETDMPYAAFGVRPTFFDAPAMAARNATWDADTFLVPHARRRIEPNHPTDLRILLGLPGHGRRCSPARPQRRRHERLGEERR